MPFSRTRLLCFPGKKIDHVPGKEGKHGQRQSDSKVGSQPPGLEVAFPILKLQYIRAHESLISLASITAPSIVDLPL
jgi:hypothetical protein